MSASDRGPVEMFAETGRAVSDIGLALLQPERLGVALVGLSVKGPRSDGDELLLVLRGVDSDGTAVVSFTSATTLDECFRSARARLRNGSMKWRVDEYVR